MSVRARAPAAALHACPRRGARAARRRAATAAVEVASAPAGAAVERLRFLSPDDVRAVRAAVGTPAYVYDAATLKAQALSALAFPNAFGLTVNYAMKSSPNALFHSLGLHFDASSGYEVRRAMAAGVPAAKICLSSQELPPFFPELVRLGVGLNACSLGQLEAYGRAFPGTAVGVRFNPGLGSGGTGKTNVGGPDSSFGIWHEQAVAVREVAARHGLTIVRIHTHIGSGSDPAVWQRVAGLSLALCREFAGVTTLNLGGGFKVGRMAYEQGTDLQAVGAPVRDAFVAFAEQTGRRLALTVEARARPADSPPGTYLTANACALVATVQDVVTTSSRSFLKLDTGMTELLRPSLYGAQHPIVVVPAAAAAAAAAPTPAAAAPATARYVVVGHCCESGDLLTPAPGEAEVIAERELLRAAPGDLCVVEGAGAYCSGMAAKNYNSFPEAAEALRDLRGGLHLVRARQTLDQITANERPLPADAAL